jgi:hypothetical protein
MRLEAWDRAEPPDGVERIRDARLERLPDHGTGPPSRASK